MNKLTIIGNLTRDPVTRTVPTTNGEVTAVSFTVAVNRRKSGGEHDADFFSVTAWRGLGETCAKYLAKGRKVCVVGPVSVRTYEAADGTTRAQMEISADDVEFLSPRGETAEPAPAPAPAPTAQNAFTEVEDADLPF